MKFEIDVEKFCEMYPQLAEAIYRRKELNYAMEDINFYFDEDERPDSDTIEQLARFYLDEFGDHSDWSLFAEDIVYRYRKGELVLE